MNKTIGTVCFIVEDSKVLLALIEYPNKARLWNGIGGAVDEGETLEQAVCREISEETKVVVNQDDVTKRKVLNLDGLDLHIYTAEKWRGELEIIDPTLKELRWFTFDEIPYKEMHEGNDKWLPEILRDS